MNFLKMISKRFIALLSALSIFCGVTAGSGVTVFAAVGNTASASGPFSDGKGTSGKPYVISTAAQLDAMRSYSGKYFKLERNIDLSTYGNGIWDPIGGSEGYFSGTLDGAGYTISGLQVDAGEPSGGLFAYAGALNIRNLSISGANVSGQDAAGIFIGVNKGKASTIINCYASGNVGGATFSGGFIGDAQEAAVTLNNCLSMAWAEGENAGGLCGINRGSTFLKNSWYNNSYVAQGVGSLTDSQAKSLAPTKGEASAQELSDGTVLASLNKNKGKNTAWVQQSGSPVLQEPEPPEIVAPDPAPEEEKEEEKPSIWDNITSFFSNVVQAVTGAENLPTYADGEFLDSQPYDDSSPDNGKAAALTQFQTNFTNTNNLYQKDGVIYIPNVNDSILGTTIAADLDKSYALAYVDKGLIHDPDYATKKATYDTLMAEWAAYERDQALPPGQQTGVSQPSTAKPAAPPPEKITRWLVLPKYESHFSAETATFTYTGTTIGSKIAPFKGSFNTNGFTIKTQLNPDVANEDERYLFITEAQNYKNIQSSDAIVQDKNGTRMAQWVKAYINEAEVYTPLVVVGNSPVRNNYKVPDGITYYDVGYVGSSSQFLSFSNNLTYIDNWKMSANNTDWGDMASNTDSSKTVFDPSRYYYGYFLLKAVPDADAPHVNIYLPDDVNVIIMEVSYVYKDRVSEFKSNLMDDTDVTKPSGCVAKRVYYKQTAPVAIKKVSPVPLNIEVRTTKNNYMDLDIVSDNVQNTCHLGYTSSSYDDSWTENDLWDQLCKNKLPMSTPTLGDFMTFQIHNKLSNDGVTSFTTAFFLETDKKVIYEYGTDRPAKGIINVVEATPESYALNCSEVDQKIYFRWKQQPSDGWEYAIYYSITDPAIMSEDTGVFDVYQQWRYNPTKVQRLSVWDDANNQEVPLSDLLLKSPTYYFNMVATRKNNPSEMVQYSGVQLTLKNDPTTSTTTTTTRATTTSRTTTTKTTTVAASTLSTPVIKTSPVEPNAVPADETVRVTITSAENATIYYSLDGKTPTTASYKYTKPFSVSAPSVTGGKVTVTAIAIEDGYKNSAAAKATITFTSTSLVPLDGKVVDIEDYSWSDIKSAVDATDKATFTVVLDSNGNNIVNRSALSAIKGKDITMLVDTGSSEWIIMGNDVRTARTNVNMGVEYSNELSVIPAKYMTQFSKVPYGDLYQMDLAHNGSFPFDALLQVYLKRSNAGRYATLYYYNEKVKSMDYQENVPIDKEGRAQFFFSHASKYVIVITDNPVLVLSAGAQAPSSNSVPHHQNGSEPLQWQQYVLLPCNSKRRKIFVTGRFRRLARELAEDC